MPRLRSLATPPRLWLLVAVLLAGGALLAGSVNRNLLDWQPGLALAEPWRAITAVAVHYSSLHLTANLVGTLLVALLGWVAQVSGRMVWAWCAAWPLTQWGLLLKPELLHYGGLSGVLHAGVGVACVHLVMRGLRSQRLIGAAILLGAVIKVIGEAPWGASLRHGDGWDIAVAPLAHATGLAAGVACAMLAGGVSRLRSDR